MVAWDKPGGPNVNSASLHSKDPTAQLACCPRPLALVQERMRRRPVSGSLAGCPAAEAVTRGSARASPARAARTFRHGPRGR